ncbi:MAG: transposase [Chloroflexi bacterium]|nr:transposase [Chloroflexota bacterium]
MTALAIAPNRKHIALYLRFQRRNFKAPAVQQFVQHLLRHIRGPIVLLWDSARIHRDARVFAWCEYHPRLHVEHFPGYAPELNPAEYVWCQSDSVLANSLVEDLANLHSRLSTTRRRLAHSHELLWACVHASDLPWT